MNTTLRVRSVSVALWVLLLACEDDPDPVGEVKAAETSADAGVACDAAGCTPPTPPTLFVGGDGTAEDPFLIDSCAALQAMENDLDAHYRVTWDIDCFGFDAGDGQGFRPIGTAAAPFTGTLDGGAFYIGGVYIDRPTMDEVGFFGVTQGATISEVALTATDVIANDYVGKLVGRATATTLREVFAIGLTRAHHHVGGLIGRLDGGSLLIDSYHGGPVECYDQLGAVLVGQLDGATIETSFSKGGIYDTWPPLLVESGSTGPVVDSFFDCEDAGWCVAEDPTALPTEEIQDSSFLSARGWDFSEVWGVGGDNPPYVCLQWQFGCDAPATGDDDTTCDGVDDDSDGSVDEDYASESTSCGLGACAAAGSSSCVDGEVVDDCVPGSPAPSDASCDASDDDCDGSVDEDFASEATTCGAGACASTGSTSCVGGAVVDSCTAGTGAPADASCDGVDDDCDGLLDEDFVSATTTCGAGVCASTGSTSCVGGAVVDSCTAGTGAPSDPSCDGVDDDCDGLTDEDFAAMSTSCGTGACAASGTVECVGGSVVDSCTPGIPAPADLVCDGADEDCDGLTDESFIGAPTTCGVGTCTAVGVTTCVLGAVVNVCVPGTPAPDDSVCDGADEDCDGSVDEDAPGAPSCLDANAPTWPGGSLVVTASTQTSATLEWSQASDDTAVTAYRVYVDGVLTQTVAAATRTATISGLVPGIPTEFVVQAIDAAENESVDGPTLIFSPTVVPPDPTTVAPPLDPSGTTSTYDAVSFLFEGPNPIQDGVTPGAIVPERASVLFGQVYERGGAPLPGVRVSVLNHPEYGFTYSRADGRFDLVVSGGGVFHLVYERDGFIQAQRTETVPWERQVSAEDVILIPYDPNVTQIDLASATEIQVHRGSVVDDGDGARQATLLFAPGTTATMRMPNGSEQPLTTLDVRATEFTIGEEGPETMPGIMPEHIAYTYAVELSVDQAVAAGAASVEFSSPVAFYLENFIDMPVGAFVPVGFYDRQRGAWIPSENGLVVSITSTTGGIAQIDLNGDGLAEPDAEVSSVGISLEERVRLASLYPSGSELWRVGIPHFTPWDANWPFGPPEDAPSPNAPIPLSQTTNENSEGCGSILKFEDQVLAEAIPIAGTSFSLRYQSDRVPGRREAFQVRIPAAPPGTPPDGFSGILEIVLNAQIAGQRFSFVGGPGDFTDEDGERSVTFEWDGRDAYGRRLTTAARGRAELCYNYRATPLVSIRSGGGELDGFERIFGSRGRGGVGISTNRIAMTVSFCRSSDFIVRGVQWDPRSIGLGGMNLDVHHQLDRSVSIFYGGDGSSTPSEDDAAFTAAGNGQISPPPTDGAPAAETAIQPSALAVDTRWHSSLCQRGADLAYSRNST